MFVITADQVDSRGTPDRVYGAVTRLNAVHDLTLAAERTAGDEIQLLTDDAAIALAIILDLTRESAWSIGLGVGAVRTPLPTSTRAATGSAFFFAREAVDVSKNRLMRFALVCRDGPDAMTNATDAQALIDLLLTVRARRSDAGWELHALLVTGMTQAEAAHRLGISPPAASYRARAGALRVEIDAVPALVRLLDSLDRRASESEGTS